MMRPTTSVLGLFVCLGFLLIGCGGDPAASVEINPGSGHLAALAEIYQMYQTREGRIPTEDEFKQYGAGVKSTLRKFKIGSFDEMLISERDQQPFVFLFDNKKMKYEESPIFAHEAQGANGKRMIATVNGVTTLIDESEFAGLKK